jgi:hypothetical protein
MIRISVSADMAVSAMPTSDHLYACTLCGRCMLEPHFQGRW